MQILAYWVYSDIFGYVSFNRAYFMVYSLDTWFHLRTKRNHISWQDVLLICFLSSFGYHFLSPVIRQISI